MKLLEIVAEFHGERNRWPVNDPETPEDFTIIGQVFGDRSSEAEIINAGLDPNEPFAVKGVAGADDLERGVHYRFFGSWTTYFSKYHGRNETQFTFRSFVTHVPRDSQGVANYLAARSKGCGIGPRKALDLVRTFGADDVLAICREEPQKIALASGITEQNANEIARRLKDSAAIESATLEVEQLLHGRKFPRSTTRKAIKLWGNRAAEAITENPYHLMRFRGIGFGLSDQLWKDLGKDLGDPLRQALCVWYVMAGSQSGDTWYHVDHVVRLAGKQVGSQFDPRAAIIHGKQLGAANPEAYGAIATTRTTTPGGPIDSAGKFLWLAEGKYAAIEDKTAKLLAEAVTENRSRTFTRYEEASETESTVLDFARCRRCSRLLTAPEVHVFGNRPYGPTCIGYVDPAGQQSEKITLGEWCERNPEVKTIVYQQPKELVHLKDFSLWPEVDAIEGISRHQRDELAKSLSSRVGILGGSPGTGKTFTVAALIKAILKSGVASLADIAIGAPTGKAAVRITESLAAQGVDAIARTWHSLLGVAKSDEDGGEWSFLHGKKKPWPYRILIGDESSMLTLPLISSVLSARSPGCHALFVGDVHQLPPVGNGAPFRDMIDGGLAYGELREIQRNSGGIVEACAAIRDCQEWTREYRNPGQNLWITGDATAETQKQRILSLLTDSGVDPVWDCQVITALNEKSQLSRESLNEMLQGELNPSQPIDGTNFRLGDKVICLSNDWYTSPEAKQSSESGENGEIYVANGEIGRVEDYTLGRIVIRLDSPARTVCVPIVKGQDGKDKNKKGNWDLAYAVSCHKYQGSEQKTVVVALDSYPAAKMVCDRSWVYTAISRAKRFCYLVGEERTANAFCRVSKMHQRKTFLAEKIRRELLEIQSEGL